MQKKHPPKWRVSRKERGGEVPTLTQETVLHIAKKDRKHAATATTFLRVSACAFAGSARSGLLTNTR